MRNLGRTALRLAMASNLAAFAQDLDFMLWSNRYAGAWLAIVL